MHRLRVLPEVPSNVERAHVRDYVELCGDHTADDGEGVKLDEAEEVSRMTVKLYCRCPKGRT